MVETDYFENVTITTLPEGSNSSEPHWGVSNHTMLEMVAVLDRIFPAFATISNGSTNPTLRWRLGHAIQVRTKTLKAIPWTSVIFDQRHALRFCERRACFWESVPCRNVRCSALGLVGLPYSYALPEHYLPGCDHGQNIPERKPRHCSLEDICNACVALQPATRRPREIVVVVKIGQRG